VLYRLGANLRYARGLRSYLRHTLSVPAAHTLIRQHLAVREQTFLTILERGVYANERSPYRRLLLHAAIGLDDVRRMVEQSGVEGALHRLYDAGVYVSLDEFKGRAPIHRPGLEFGITGADFDNPLLEAHYAGQTSGSRGVTSRLLIDLEFMAYEAAGLLSFLAANGAASQPAVVWRASPPASDGLRAVLRYARIDKMPERWFSPSRAGRDAEGLRARLFIAYTLLASRAAFRPIPIPRFVPRDRVVEVARWLAGRTAHGAPAVMISNASPVLRVCLAAREHGLDISGTSFVCGGEPLTPAKAAVLSEVGARPLPAYAMQELGTISFGCADPVDIDEMHVLNDKLALIQREKRFAESGPPVQALIYTGILTSGPKLMLNVESGDYGDVTRRECSCELGALGLSDHLSNVRSYEKLTSEGVTFMGTSLYDLLERVLPAHFGGSPHDYQLVEEEDASGLPRVSLVVSPSVGPVAEDAVLGVVFDTLSLAQGGPVMVSQWRQGGTLRVVRRDPYFTGTSKVLPLHVLRGASTTPSPAETPAGRRP
jgi:hypothetical protein